MEKMWYQNVFVFIVRRVLQFKQNWPCSMAFSCNLEFEWATPSGFLIYRWVMTERWAIHIEYHKTQATIVHPMTIRISFMKGEYTGETQENRQKTRTTNKAHRPKISHSKEKLFPVHFISSAYRTLSLSLSAGLRRNIRGGGGLES